MSYTVIDKKEEVDTFGVWPVNEKVTTTLTLLNLGGGQIGTSYDSKFDGVKGGHVQGGPIVVDGDNTAIVNESPKVTVIVSEYKKNANYISMHVAITVDIPVIGMETIYSQTLGGYYEGISGWTAAIGNINIKE